MLCYHIIERVRYAVRVDINEVGLVATWPVYPAGDDMRVGGDSNAERVECVVLPRY